MVNERSCCIKAGSLEHISVISAFEAIRRDHHKFMILFIALGIRG
jgi:hypothetical protein